MLGKQGERRTAVKDDKQMSVKCGREDWLGWVRFDHLDTAFQTEEQ